MLKDIGTVMWKEWRELLCPEGKFAGGARNVAVMIGVAGLLFPLQSGRAWFESWLTVYTACFPAILVLNFTADSIAGERERHTLETLLASRLPDRAIVLGKTLAIAAYGWGIVLVCQPVAVVAVNVVHGKGELLFYRPAILLSIVAASLVLAALTSAAGVLCSMTAPTARAAAQRMLIPFIVVFALPGFLPNILVRLDPSWKTALGSLSPGHLVGGMVFVGGVAAFAVMAVAVTRFTRARVVLA